MRFVIALLLAVPARAETVTVAVASNFLAPFEELAAVWSEQTGHEVAISSGATGLLFAQIARGAPFDLFLAADAARPERLEAGGIGQGRRAYALGRLALWGLEGASAGSLSAPIGRLAIANPESAPYGAAALEVLAREGAEVDTVLTGENAAQAYLFARTGNADLAFVPLAFVLGDARAWEVPSDWHAPIRQELIVLTDGPAADLAEWLTTPAAQSLIEMRGYASP